MEHITKTHNRSATLLGLFLAIAVVLSAVFSLAVLIPVKEDKLPDRDND